MSNTQEILKTALLGTDKYLPNLIFNAPTYQKSLTTEKERDFLRQANISFLMDEAGQVLHQSKLEIDICLEEKMTLLNHQKSQLVKSFIQNDDENLFNFLLCYCTKSKQVLPAELVPTILNKALQQLKTSQSFISVCGEMGKWLCSLNKKWNVLLENSNVELDWELGNLQSRKNYLIEIRKNNPQEAISILEQILPKENANNRLELLSCLHTRLSIQDEAFLLHLENDKSQKIKDFVLELLIQLKDTKQNKKAIDNLKQFFAIKEERHLIISKKKVLHFDNSVQPDDSFFKLGIEKISNIKGVTDAEFWMFQLFSMVHPQQICTEYNIAEQELLQLLMKIKHFKELSQYIVNGIVKFNYENWAIELMKNSENPSIQLLNCISESTRKNYYSFFSKSNPFELADYFMDGNYVEMEIGFANNLIGVIETNPYQNYSNFYQKLALHLPINILPKLKAYLQLEKEDAQFTYFKNQIQEIIRIIEIKQILIN
jgi:hypothetical protein